jgi:hypothetical protein
MKRMSVYLAGASAVLFALLVVAVQADDTASAPSAGYDLGWWTVDGGGVTGQSGSAYGLDGTAAQPDAQTWRGGDYTLTGGFWGGEGTSALHNYLPLVLK